MVYEWNANGNTYEGSNLQFETYKTRNKQRVKFCDCGLAAPYTSLKSGYCDQSFFFFNHQNHQCLMRQIL